MGLDFANIPDDDGAAVYVLHHPTVSDTRKFEDLKKSILLENPKSQVVLLEVNSAQGEQVRDFYDIMPESLPIVMIIADDDSILYQWSASEIPASDVISSQLRRTNGR